MIYIGINLNAPDIILRNEKRMLQEAVDSLLDNDMRSGKTVVAAAGQKRPLKSLADILKGKQGRFRQNLLGKRVDYSARSVIVVGPYLKLYQCGLPKIMAIELFRPFVISQLIKRELVHNVRSANRFIEGGSKEVWDILEEIVNKSLVLLNRAPTLHRLSIQAFQPVLIEGKAIQIHPLVCTAFNADFDGDQMAVHLPISERAQEEARTLMLASKNLLKPANGYPIVNPTKDIVWGVYYLTHIDERLRKSDADIKVFSEAKEALFVYQSGRIAINEPIKIREDGKFIETSIGRIIFRSALPEGLYALDKVVDSKELSEIINECTERYGSEKTAELVDDIKELGYHSITLSGLSWGFKDLPGLPEKEDMIKKAEQQIVEVQEQIGMGLLTADEAYQKNVEIWMATKRELDNIAMSKLDPYSPVSTMVKSGARGSKDQLTQIFSMRGLVGSPSGKLIDVPVKSSFREGLNALEYFISSHGSRKGTSDTALRTASAGYLTRRMVDVAQEVIITEEDCGDTEGFLFIKDESPFQEPFVQRLAGRFILDDIIDPSDEKKILVKKGSMVAASFAKSHKDLPISKIRIRSPLTCKTNRGICAVCYGTNLAYNKKVEIGTPVGVIGAQSIGEPGTQLVLRTFHTGGVAGRDITQGLPRVEELLEVRPPKNRGYLVPVNGKIKIIEKEKSKIIQLFYKDKKEEQYAIKKNSTLFVKDGDTVAVGDKIIEIDEEEIVANHAGTARIVDATVSIEYTDDEMMEFEVVGHKKILVKDGDEVKRGTQLSDGDLDLHELYTLRSKEEAQRYILSELKYIYAMQGQRLNDRHIEVIVRQMFSRVLITDGGDTEFLNDEVISRSYFNQINAMIKEKGKRAVGEELLLGITRSALSTESVLAAASFQETSRILINASISGRVDHLYGLKENVIIGRLIPAGTGFKKKP
ncbi:MAG: DNA-directed RNA polymerase subunit beta' [Parcubacteria group bacterium]|nr:DNA-directed RNA polymerase subunit beta' [Parcubacteria group bacterium]